MFKVLTSCLFLCVGGAALADGPAAAVTYASCLMCHGDGQGAGAIPAIQGRPYEELMTALGGFAGAGGTATIMHRFTAGLTAEEVEGLARYISGLEGTPR